MCQNIVVVALYSFLVSHGGYDQRVVFVRLDLSPAFSFEDLRPSDSFELNRVNSVGLMLYKAHL